MDLNLQSQRTWAGNLGGVLAAENLAAELTEAAFPVALQHGLGKDWLQVKLNLWNALTKTVKHWSLAN